MFLSCLHSCFACKVFPLFRLYFPPLKSFSFCPSPFVYLYFPLFSSLLVHIMITENVKPAIWGLLPKQFDLKSYFCPNISKVVGVLSNHSGSQLCFLLAFPLGFPSTGFSNQIVFEEKRRKKVQNQNHWRIIMILVLKAWGKEAQLPNYRAAGPCHS